LAQLTTSQQELVAVRAELGKATMAAEASKAQLAQFKQDAEVT
jgi:hypothetical protein